MKIPTTETTNTRQWLGPEWKIVPYLYLDLPIPSPAPLTKLHDWKSQGLVVPGEFTLRAHEEGDADTEDFLDARATEFKYETVGIKGFSSYREYRRRKLEPRR